MRPNVGGYRDVPDFIYGITREIWEDRGIGGKLDRYYAPDILLRAPTGLTTSNAGVTAQTLQTLHQFPDRQLVGEDVIWDDGGDGSFLSSHRLISVMRHQGDGSYGPASNRIVHSRIVADCWVVGTVVTEEWLVRDQASFARCLGLAPRDLARRMVDDDIRRGQPIGFFVPEHDRKGRYVPRIADDPDVARVIAGYERIWGRKETEAVRDLYFHGANLHAPGGETFCGHLDIDRFLLGYLVLLSGRRIHGAERAGQSGRQPANAHRAALVAARHACGIRPFRPAHGCIRLHHGDEPPDVDGWQGRVRMAADRRGLGLEADPRA